MATQTQTRSDRTYTLRHPSRTARPAPSRPRRASRTLPGWRELAKENEKVVRRPKRTEALDQISTAKFALLILSVAAAFTLYVGHVHATQEALADVQQLRRENLRLHMQANRLQGEYDRLIGPSEIYERAFKLGLVEGVDYGATLTLDR